MILRFIESIGDKTIHTISSLYEALKFTSICLIHMVQPRSYNPAMKMVLTKQIYFTAVGIIPAITKITRTHAMGCLLLPVILYFAF